MKVSGAFPGNYLKADDLGPARPVLIIRQVEMEDIGDDHKPVVYFEHKEKGLVLNKTNANAIVEIAGTDEMDDWPGTTIRLYSTMVDFQGRRVPAIRVEKPPAAVVPKKAPKPDPIEASDTDDVPF